MIYKIVRAHPDELCHHGISGQKWGIRRYQNEDGSYTTEGLSRYKRGKIYSKEHDKFEREEYDRLVKGSKKYRNAEKEVERLSEKYGIDEDGNKMQDWLESDGSYNGHSNEDRDRARQRIWENKENMSALSDSFHSSAAKTAGKRLTDRYGSAAISDMNHYNNVKTIAWIGGLSALTIGFAAYNRASKH